MPQIVGDLPESQHWMSESTRSLRGLPFADRDVTLDIARGMRVMARPAFASSVGNPYTRALYSHLARFGLTIDDFSPAKLRSTRYSVLHLHWPDSTLGRRNPVKVLSAARSLLRDIDVARARGTKVVWTIHNLRSHERFHPFIEPQFWNRFTGRLDGVFSLSREGLNTAVEAFPKLRTVPKWVIPHSHYRGLYPDSISRDQAREQLGIPPDSKVLGFVGRIRPYKNIEPLMRGFRQVQSVNARLIVAGKPNLSRLAKRLRAASRRDPRILLEPRFIPDHEIQVYARAADLVVLPFSEVLNSGSALLALSFDRPVLVPFLGALPELANLVGGDWVRTYEGPLTADTLEDGLDWALKTVRGLHAPLQAMDPERIAKNTLEAFVELARAAQSVTEGDPL